jgi:hypothetical protein
VTFKDGEDDMKFILAAGLFCFAIVAHAAAKTVYLDCAMTNGTKVVTWKVILDEKNQTASYSIPGVGAVSKHAAVFLPEKVSFDSIVISRIDLSITRTVNVSGSVKSDQGQCKIADRPQTKF